MVKKIYFLVISPFTSRDYKRFGIDLLEKNDFMVKVWDTTNIYFPEEIHGDLHIIKNHHAVREVFENEKEVLEKLKNLSSDSLVITVLPCTRKYYSLFQSISMSDAPYAFFVANVQFKPRINTKEIFRKTLPNLEKTQTGCLSKFLNYSFQKLPLSWAGMKPARFLLAGGKKSIKHPTPTDKTTETIWAHTLDYDLYLEDHKNPITEKPMAIFLDEFLPFHSDFFRENIQPPVRSDNYYPLLNQFFASIEKQLKLKVIIAAHPQSHYEKLPGVFGKRLCVIGQTMKLTKESKLVLAHNSTSLNFANLYFKPVIFMTSSEIERTFKGPFIRKTASLFGKIPRYFDTENTFNLDIETQTNPLLYKKFRRRYIKTDHSEELSFWQIVANRVKKGI